MRSALLVGGSLLFLAASSTTDPTFEHPILGAVAVSASGLLLGAGTMVDRDHPVPVIAAQ